MTIIRIGRDESNHYLVKHPSVSRFHSEIHIDRNGTIVYVDHSANGTMINGIMVHNAQYNLMGYETIYLANMVALNLSEVMGQFYAKDHPTCISQQGMTTIHYATQDSVKPVMGFGETLGYFFQHYFDFSSRARRSEFWYMYLWNLIFFLIPFWGIISFIPFLALSVRRLHDVGKGGAWLLIIFVPVIGAIVLLVWFATDSEHSTNRWGKSPKYN